MTGRRLSCIFANVLTRVARSLWDGHRLARGLRLACFPSCYIREHVMGTTSLRWCRWRIGNLSKWDNKLTVHGYTIIDDAGLRLYKFYRQERPDARGLRLFSLVR